MLRVMSQEKIHFDAPSPIERLFSRMFGAHVGLGLGFSHNYQLEVRGRRSGRLYSTPVDVLVHRGRRFLVAGRGETQWVRNARASGQITLRKGRRREELRVRIVPDVEKPDVLKATSIGSSSRCSATSRSLPARQPTRLLRWPRATPSSS